MLVAVLGSAVIGVVAAAAGLRLFPRRLPSPTLTVTAAEVGALVGGLITRFVLGGAHPAAPVAVALVVAAAGMSLLLREPATARRTAAGPRTA